MSAAPRRPGATVVLRALAPFVLYAVARDVDVAVGILLHSTLDLPGFVGQALSLLDPADLARHASISVAIGLVVWFVLALIRSRASAVAFADALTETAPSFAVLLLRPFLTLLALLSLAVQPTYPYAFTLPVALGQDLSIAVDAAILAALAAAHLPRPRLPAPGALSLAFLAFLAYALITPESARRWEGHPGNEPKTLRMAVALGHGLTLDVEGVSAGMEALTPRPLMSAAGAAARGLVRESARMAAALAHGARGGRVRHPRHAHHAPDHPGQGGRRLHRPRARAVAAARARPARRPRAEPGAGDAGPAGGDRPLLECAGSGAGGGRVPPRARRGRARERPRASPA